MKAYHLMVLYKTVLFGLIFVTLFSFNLFADATTKTRVIVDADTANEIDDLYAIVRALIAPEFQVEGITSAHFTRSTKPNDTVHRSQELNAQILSKLNLSDVIPHPVGADRSMSAPDQPIDSPAARLIIARAHAGGPDDKVVVFALGACTNLASALLLDPSIEPKVVFAFIDGNYEDGKWGPGIFNWRNDIHAVKAIFESNVEYLHMPAPAISRELSLSKQDVNERMKGRGEVWDLLARRWETFPRTAKSDSKVMWDLALIEAVIRPELATRIEVGAPIIHDARKVEQFPDNPRRVTVFSEIDEAEMELDFWKSVETFISK